MKIHYSFSPITSRESLFEAIASIHLDCQQLCFNSFGRILPNAGNMGVFCHYLEEYEFLFGVREELTEPSENPDQKYFKLHSPITFPAKDRFPETTYTHLYIRKPDPYRHHAGDVDFYLPPEEYSNLKSQFLSGNPLPGARVFDRNDLDMIELFHPDIDALAYVSTEKMSTDVRIKISPQK